jgi:6-phosphogluconate dehydrogenase
MMQAASREYKWGIDLGEMARIWKGGCIIRAQFLDRIKTAYRTNPELPNLLHDPNFRDWVGKAQGPWRRVVRTAQELGIPVPAMSASLAYYDSVRAARLPQNLTQAQRDFFGAHTYERVDRPCQGPFHTEWVASIAAEKAAAARAAGRPAPARKAPVKAAKKAPPRTAGKSAPRGKKKK